MIEHPDFFAHESSYVDEGAIIGSHTKIWHFSHVQAGARIGERCVLGQNVNVGPGVIVGNGCKIQNNVSLYEGVVLEDEVFCGPSSVFTNDLKPRAQGSQGWRITSTLLKHGASVGANATIVCGNTLGEYCMVVSGSVVTHDVLPYALVVGIPARQIGWVCKCGTRLDPELVCPQCESTYRKSLLAIEPV
jgi:UDP-2-acetamido-3-amino-2,3-dideoxy-glucuronate N-acetyltransferase